MSFLGGAECSTAGNPLAQFTKHTQDDKSLQRDRLAGRSPAAAHESFRSVQTPGQQDHLMDDFAQQQPAGLLPQGHNAPFAMEQMRQGLDNFPMHHVPVQSNGWASEYHPHLQNKLEFEASVQQNRQANAISTADFQRFQQRSPDQRSSSASPLQNSNLSLHQNPTFRTRPFFGGVGMGGIGGMGGMGMMNAQIRPQDMEQGVDKGKGRMVELDDKNWEEQFAQIDAAKQDATDKEAEAAIEQELDQVDRSVTETNHSGDFEAIWRGIKSEQAEKASSYLEDQSGFDDFDLNEFLKNPPPLRSFDNDNLRQAEPYMFEDENIFQDIANPFAEGQRILEEGGNLSLAALAFEAAVRKDQSHVAAWTLLGSAQAQNEKEIPAIRALEHAIKLDPSNLDALLGLAVSYTNESWDSSAYRTLERWLSTKYPQLHPSSEVTPVGELGYTDRSNLHEKLTALFIKAARLSPAGEQMDPDVQVGLGVLFYGAEEYDKAVDCFSAALASTEAGTSNQRQQVHLLWNRLGATLANSGRSEEAITAYEKALTLRPNFVRARYNLGVSCINIGCYAEAAQHLLGALAMHDDVVRQGREKAREVVGKDVSETELEALLQQNQSTNLYDTLKRVFNAMDRKDLVERVGFSMDVASFRSEFEF